MNALSWTCFSHFGTIVLRGSHEEPFPRLVHLVRLTNKARMTLNSEVPCHSEAYRILKTNKIEDLDQLRRLVGTVQEVVTTIQKFII